MISSEIRTEARKALQDRWGTAALITFIYSMFSFLVSKILNGVDENSSIIILLEIIYFVISVPISFGLMISMMKLRRSESVGAFDFFKDGFANFKRSWSITGNILKKLVIYLIVAIFGVLLFAFSLTFSVAQTIITASASSFTLATFLGLFIYLAALILMIPKSLLYVLAIYISVDNPEMSAREAVDRSADLMMGNRWKYFCLSFSFIGWAIATAFTLGIGSFWLVPYMQVSMIVFYDNLAGNINSNPVTVKAEDSNEESDGPIKSGDSQE